MNNIEPCLWLQKRAEMYAAIAESDFLNLKKVDFYFSDPGEQVQLTIWI